MRVFEGSILLRSISPKFDSLEPEGRTHVRQELARILSHEDDFIMDGHYSFGNEIAFTEDDGKLYDVFLYLYVSPEILKDRISASQKNLRYLDQDIVRWQEYEIVSLRKFCHENDKDFYVLDNPPTNYFDDISSCRELFEADWGRASAEERAKIRLFEIELSAETVTRHDMRLFDEAYDRLWEECDITHTVSCARRYFSGGKTEHPIWEIASDQKAVAIRDLSELLAE